MVRCAIEQLCIHHGDLEDIIFIFIVQHEVLALVVLPAILLVVQLLEILFHLLRIHLLIQDLIIIGKKPLRVQVQKVSNMVIGLHIENLLEDAVFTFHTFVFCYALVANLLDIFTLYQEAWLSGLEFGLQENLWYCLILELSDLRIVFKEDLDESIFFSLYSKFNSIN